MFKTIAGFFGKMLGTDKAVESLIGNASNALDKLYYSAEEKAEDIAKDRSEARRMVVDWMRNTEGQNIARRFLAILISGIWVLQYMAMMTLNVMAVWMEKPEEVIKSAQVIGDFASNMNGAMMLILGFYFAAPHLGDIAKGALERFGGTPKPAPKSQQEI